MSPPPPNRPGGRLPPHHRPNDYPEHLPNRVNHDRCPRGSRQQRVRRVHHAAVGVRHSARESGSGTRNATPFTRTSCCTTSGWSRGSSSDSREIAEQTAREELQNIKGMPWASTGVIRGDRSTRPTSSSSTVPIDPPEVFAPRNMKVTKKRIEKYGHIPSCQKYRMIALAWECVACPFSRVPRTS